MSPSSDAYLVRLSPSSTYVKRIVQLCTLWVVCMAGLASAAQTDIAISDVDDRDYRHYTLANGLQVLLISDPQADKAAAALDVYVGSADNPKEREGLAHFLEHMLFLGTEKFPEPDDYQAFISANGGSHNAFTSTEHTNYFFDVKADALKPTLERFSQFFVAPLFTKEYVERERNAVNSEYSARIKDDMRRTFDAVSEVINPAHPLAKFSVGSLETLADDERGAVRDDLLKFYAKYYTADIMTLVVSGREELDQLQAWVDELFSAVPKRANKPERKPEPMFLPGQLPMRLSVVPEKEVRSISLLFPVPDTRPHYRKKPIEFIANLLGHEGEGSLLALLKAQGWAESLSAGGGLDDRFNSSLLVSIRLTESGWEARDKVVGLVFDTIARIKAEGLDRWRYQEQGQLARLAFRFSEKQEPMRTVSYLAGQMQEYPVEEAYSAGSIYEKFDRKLIKKYLGYLTAENLFLQETAPEVSTDKISQHYQTPYAVAPLEGVQWPSDEKLSKNLALPSKNPFIPSDLDLVAAKSSVLPTKLTDSNTLVTWFQADPSFGVPKGRIKIRLKLPAATAGVESSVLMSLYTRMVKESLNSLSYPAFLAGLSYNIGGNSRGLDIEIGGYSDKQAKLLAAINDTLTNTDTLMPEFDRVRTQVARNWRNNASQPPYTQLYGELSAVMFSPSWTIAERITSIDSLDEKAMAKFIEGLYRGGKAEIMVYGNFDRDSAQRVQSLVANLIKQPSDMTLAKAEVVKLELGETHFWHSVDHPDHALLGYLQGHNDTLEEQANIRLLQQVVASDFFNSLRTEQQLGYVVTATRVQLKEVPALLTVVQSPTTSAAGLIKANHDFFAGLPMPTEEDFQRYQAAVLVELREKPKSMAEQASILWGNIASGRDEFDLRQALAAELEKLSLADFTAFYRSRVLEQGRWLWLAAGNEAAREGGLDQIPVVEAFKRDSENYQYP